MSRERLSPQEAEKLAELGRIGDLALQAAARVHDELGPAGKDKVEKNQFGDTAMRVDIEAEEAVLAILRRHNVAIRVVSEEHGSVTIGENPLYTGFLDGLDGSDLYKKQQGTGRYGTMFGISAGTDPLYRDYLYGGIMEHAAKRLYSATKGGGSWVTADGTRTPIHCSSGTEFDENNRLYADLYFDKLYGTDVLKSIIARSKRPFVSMQSSAIHYADLAQGAVDGVVECTRKGNLEIAIAYALLRESGGVMVDGAGRSLANQRYFDFGQRDHRVVISACTPAMATSMVQGLR